MGFFSDIVRDSRRESGFPAVKGTSIPVSKGSDGPPFPAGTSSGNEKRASLEDRISPSEMMSGSRAWEEGDRQAENASLMTLPLGPVTRQVVDPWLSENTFVGGLPAATGLLSTSPNPGKQKLAGSENARTGTAAQSTDQKSAFSDGVFANVCSISVVGDSQVEEPLSLRQAHSTGNMSVENRGRRQAGIKPRAGSATPPNLSFGKVEEMKPGGLPAGKRPAMSGEQSHASPKGPLRPEQTQQGGPVRNFPLIESAGQSKPLSPLSQASEVDLSRNRLAAPTPSLSQGVRVEKRGTESQVSPALEGCSVVTSGEIEPQDKTFDKDEMFSCAEILISEVPAPAQKRINFGFKAPQTTGSPAKQGGEPRVRIGLLEVVVVCPEQGARADQGKERASSNLASRFYLRNV